MSMHLFSGLAKLLRRKSVRAFARRTVVGACLACGLGLLGAPASYATIYGTMSNFDTYNTTPEPSEGAEIEIEGCHSSDVTSTFPAHYNSMRMVEYVEGSTFGTRVIFEDYNFNVAVTLGSLAPNPNPASTNGHALVNADGGEHFGFASTVQPTAMRFYWLNRSAPGQYDRIGTMPVTIPNPVWNYVPGNGGGAPQIEAEVRVPEPAEFHVQRPDSIWMKVFKTELPRAVELDELMSGDDPGNIVPQDEAEIESEWELLEGGKMKMHGGELDDEDSKAVVRRYEFFQYLGAYDDEHEPLSAFLNEELLEPPVGELGPFIAANMVAANLVAPPARPGDFTGDDVVDGADFLAWQQQLGTEGAAPADGTGDGIVDAADLDLWRQNFSPAEQAAAAVPEPETATLMIVVIFASALRWAPATRKRRSRGTNRPSRTAHVATARCVPAW